jgi:RNA polymerase sigma-70 factor (ECF subfamily)
MGASGTTVLSTGGPARAGARDAVTKAALDGEQVRALFEAHYDGIWRLLRRLGVPERSADDAAQQVFLILAERHEVVRAGSERAFLYGTALRLASSLRRVAQREVLSEDFDERDSAEARPDELAEQKRARDLLDVVLARLEGDLLRVFALYELEDFTLPEIAELLSIPLGTATSRLRRSREQFRAQLAEVMSELAARQAKKAAQGAQP